MTEDFNFVDFDGESKNQLVVIIENSNLDKTKAKYILDNFQDYFNIADEWERKAKAIVVTDETQVTEMKIARTGRLFLREKRLAVEKARKNLKEQSLREGKAIDGIANVLKALIVPIEEYLEKQEKFVEIKEAKRLQLLKEEEDRKAEQERIRIEQQERERQAKIEAENRRLRAEAAERERVLAEERRKAQEKENEIRKKAEEEKQKAMAEHERKLAEERRERERAERELFLRREQERKQKEKTDQEAERLLRASDAEKIASLANQIRKIEIPKVKSKRSLALMEEVRQYLKEIITALTEQENF